MNPRTSLALNPKSAKIKLPPKSNSLAPSPKQLLIFKTLTGSHYELIGTLDSSQNLKDVYWVRQFPNGGRKVLGKDVACVTYQQYEEVISQNLPPAETIKLAQNKGLCGVGGIFLYIENGELYSSSSVKEEPEQRIETEQGLEFLTKFFRIN